MNRMKAPKSSIRPLIGALALMATVVSIGAQCLWDYHSYVCHTHLPATAPTTCTTGIYPHCTNYYTCDQGTNSETGYICDYLEAGGGIMSGCEPFSWNWRCTANVQVTNNCPANCGTWGFGAQEKGSCIGHWYWLC